MSEESLYEKHLLVIDALIGAGFPSIEQAVLAQKMGMARFSGNQHNPDWQWRREVLEAAPYEMVYDLWRGARSKELAAKAEWKPDSV